jgi:hypothetical protein
VCRWGADYGDFDWTVLIRTLERVSSSGVLESRGEQGAREGVRPQTRLGEAWIRIQSASLCTFVQYARTCTAPDVQHARSSAREGMF